MTFASLFCSLLSIIYNSAKEEYFNHDVGCSSKSSG
jgi:hypothetical protein